MNDRERTPVERQLREYFGAIESSGTSQPVQHQTPVLDLIHDIEGEPVKRRSIWLGSAAAAVLVLVGLTLALDQGDDVEASASDPFAIVTINGRPYPVTEREACELTDDTFDIRGRGIGPDGNSFVMAFDRRVVDLDDDGDLDVDVDLVVENFGSDEDPLAVERAIFTAELNQGVDEQQADLVVEVIGENVTAAGLMTEIDGAFFTTDEGVPFTFNGNCSAS